jgi:hypothetical protein
VRNHFAGNAICERCNAIARPQPVFDQEWKIQLGSPIGAGSL